MIYLYPTVIVTALMLDNFTLIPFQYVVARLTVNEEGVSIISAHVNSSRGYSGLILSLTMNKH